MRDFYNDFDMLPYEFKEMLWNSPYQPDVDDLKAAWELAAENTTLQDLINKIKVLEPSEEEKRLARIKKSEEERKKREEAKKEGIRKNERHRTLKKDHYEMRPIYGKLRRRDPSDKHGRLVMLVSEAEAAKLLATRKENKDVELRSEWVRPIIGYEKMKIVKERGDSIPPEKPDPVRSIAKILHNAGGKPY